MAMIGPNGCISAPRSIACTLEIRGHGRKGGTVLESTARITEQGRQGIAHAQLRELNIP